jgi:hypothetical protein
MLIDALVLDVREFDTDRAAGLNRQVFEQKCFAMSGVQAAQRLESGRRRGIDLQTPQVVVQSHEFSPIIAALR